MKTSICSKEKKKDLQNPLYLKPILLTGKLSAKIEIIEFRNGLLKAKVCRINGYKAPKHLLLNAAYEALRKYKPEGYRISIIL